MHELWLMRDGRQEEFWKYASKICYITAAVQSMNPRKLKQEDFNDWEQIQKVLKQQTTKPSNEQLKQIARLFK